MVTLCEKDKKNVLIGMPVQDPKPPWVSLICPPVNIMSRLKDNGCSEGDSEFCNYKVCPILSDLVDGKRVAIVGPSGHLIGSGDGQLIDSYDIVIRVNQTPNFKEDHVRDYGKKTNILSDNFNMHGWIRFESNKEYVKKMNYILASQAWDSCPTTIEEGEKRLEQFGIPFQRIENGYFFNMCREIGTCMNTGFSTIVTMLNYDVKELYITGFSFFNMNFTGTDLSNIYNNDGDSASTWSPGMNAADARHRMNHKLHDQDSQIKYFQKVVDFHGPRGLGVLTLDNYLNKYFVESNVE